MLYSALTETPGFIKTIVKNVLRKVRVLPNLIKSELMLHKPEKISLIRLCRNLPVSSYSVLFQIHQVLFQTELSPIQEDKSIVRDDKIRDSQPCLPLCHLCLQFLNLSGLLKSYSCLQAWPWQLGDKSSKLLKFTLCHLSSRGRKQALLQNWIGSLLFHE